MGGRTSIITELISLPVACYEALSWCEAVAKLEVFPILCVDYFTGIISSCGWQWEWSHLSICELKSVLSTGRWLFS
ncbi:hypothetical protein [Arsenophonus endosymbiont of Aleurodicus dispersus]|uniref:hypothetical protein n=1 Tax=Arsenophonus endosymbiont of Aleurodicus dispersus TaxID=235559 RepID=UPI000EB5C92C|nr:hypothetical protein [Arsenophonus endosymbiont of Aleurodicus dispersus]